MDRTRRSTSRVFIATLLVAASVSAAISCKKFSRAPKAPPSLGDVAAGGQCGKSRRCDSDEIQNAPIDLPDVRYSDPPVDAPIKIVIDSSHVTIVGDPYPVANIPPPEEHVIGLYSSDKFRGRGDLYITPLAQALDGARDAVDAGVPNWDAIPRDAFDAKHSVVVIADRKTPYRIMMEVLFTAGQSELSSSYIAVRSGGAVRTLKLSGHSGMRHVAMFGGKKPGMFVSGMIDGLAFGKLSVRLYTDGISVALDGKELGKGCDGPGVGPAIARVHDAPYDFAALHACAKKAHDSVKEPDSDVSIGGADDISLGDFLAAADAVHGDSNDPLYDVVVPSASSGDWP
jgi:hypothetical protein